MAQNQKLNAVRNDFYAGNAEQTIGAVSAQLAQQNTKAQEGSLKLLLAAGYLGRRQEGDVAKSLEAFAALGADSSFPPAQRAAALNSIASVLLSEHITPAQYNAALSGAPFEAYMPAGGADTWRIQEAYRNILEASDQLYPNSFAEYALAANYYRPLLDTPSATTTSSKKIAQTIQAYIASGDSRDDRAMYSAQSYLPTIAAMYRAGALNASAKVLKNKTLGEREAAYKLALQAAEQLQEQKNKMGYPLVLRAKFFYAAFLRTELYPDRKTDIVALLQPFGQVDPAQIDVSYFKNLLKRSNGDRLRIAAQQLADDSADFKNFLTSFK